VQRVDDLVREASGAVRAQLVGGAAYGGGAPFELGFVAAAAHHQRRRCAQ
jgi:hypothetical protein